MATKQLKVQPTIWPDADALAFAAGLGYETPRPTYIEWPGVMSGELCDKVLELVGDVAVSFPTSACHVGEQRVPYDAAMEHVVPLLTELFAAGNVWQLAIDRVGADPVIKTYNAGDYYQPHLDCTCADGALAMSMKLSCTIQLSDPADYEGGDLRFMQTDGARAATRQRGTIVVFPAFGATHAVSRVTRGRRRTLVAHAYGPPLM